MAIVSVEEDLPPAETLSSSSSSSGSERDSLSAMLDEEPAIEIVLEEDAKEQGANEMDDSEQDSCRDSDVLRPSVLPKWLRDMEAGQKDMFGEVNSLHSRSSSQRGGGSVSSLHKSDGSIRSREKSAAAAARGAEIPKGSESSTDSFAPDWLKEFESEQQMLLDALDSRSSLKASGSLRMMPKEHNKSEATNNMSASLLGKTRRESEASRSSIAPEWLMGFEAEQKKLLEAMSAQAARTDQDSFAMDLDDFESEDESVATGPKDPAKKTKRESRVSVMFDFIKEFEEQQKTLLKALDSRASLIGGSMLLMDEDKPEAAAEVKATEVPVVEAPIQPPQQSSRSLRDSAASRASVVPGQQSSPSLRDSSATRPSIIPGWLLEFEKQQKTLLKTLDSSSRASMIGGSIMFTAEDRAAMEYDFSEPVGKSRRESGSSRPSIAPDWLKDFEKRQNDLLGELSILSTAQASNKGWDTFGRDDDEEEEEPDLLAPSSAEKTPQKPLKEPAEMDARNTTREIFETSTIVSVTPPPSQSAKGSNEGNKSTTQPIGLSQRLADEANHPTEPIVVDEIPKTQTPSRSGQASGCATPRAGENEFQKVQLRKSPKSMERHKTETKLEFAEMIAKALMKNGNNGQEYSSWEALRHINDLKQEVALLQQEEEVGSELWQINKLRHELLDMFDQNGSVREEHLLNWLLPKHQERNEKTGQLAMNADQVALLQAFSTSEELDMVSGLGMVKSVLQSNFKSIDGSSCLETIRDYAVFKSGKKKHRKQQPWESLTELFENAQKDGSTEDIHLRVRNALAMWIVREILGTSRDNVSSRMCFRAIFLVASLKLEMERVAPAALRKSHTHELCKSLGNEACQEDRKRSGARKGVHADAPLIVKKLLDRGQNGPKDALLAPVDLAPDDENGMSGSDKVAFVRETLVTSLEDKLEDEAKITSRKSTFVKIVPGKAIDESAVADAVKAFVLPTMNEDSVEVSMPFAGPFFSSSNNVKPAETPEEDESEKEVDHSDESKGVPAMGTFADDTYLRGSREAEEAVAASLEIQDGSGRRYTNVEQASSTDEVLSPPDWNPVSTANNSASAAGLLPSQGEEAPVQAPVTDKEDESNLPLHVQDAHRVIRTILGPSHPNITVSLCFEAIRVYANLIRIWKDECAEDGIQLKDGQKLATAGPRASLEELKLKSLEGAVLRRGAILPPAQLDMQLEEERAREKAKQEEEEQRARDSIARKREEKKKKKQLMKKMQKVEEQDASQSDSGALESAPSSEAKATTTDIKSNTASSAKKVKKSSSSNTKKSSKKKKADSTAEATTAADANDKKKQSKKKKSKDTTTAEGESRSRRKKVMGKLKGGVSKLKPKKRTKKPTDTAPAAIPE